MKAYIENYNLLIREEDEKKIKSALNRIKKAIDEINDMGYQMYMAEHGSFNVMNVEGAGGYAKNSLDFTHDMVVANVTVSGIDGGAW